MENVTVSVPKERLAEFYALLSRFFAADSALGAATDSAVTRPLPSASSSVRPIKGRYAPLFHYLIEASEDELDLSFAKLETILGDALPPSAREHRSIWANSQGSFLGRVWLRAGWRLTEIDMQDETVRFERGVS